MGATFSMTKCPIGLDDAPSLCSAGTCLVCQALRADAAPVEATFTNVEDMLAWLNEEGGGGELVDGVKDPDFKPKPR
jgi:hypothetical protein